MDSRPALFMRQWKEAVGFFEGTDDQSVPTGRDSLEGLSDATRKNKQR